MKLKSLKDLELSHKRVLLRLVLNTPLKNGKVSSDFRIRAIIPTIDYLVSENCKVIVISKVKRPYDEGGVWKKSHSLKPFVEHLGGLMGRKVVELKSSDRNLPDYQIPHIFFLKHNIEEIDINPMLSSMKEGDVAVLENIRFYQGEMNNDPKFSELLASFGDFFINDAFGDSHSGTVTHASIMGLPELLPSAAGLNMINEVEALTKVISYPKKPVVLMIGGIKLSTKAGVLRNLGKKTDSMLMAGGVGNLLLRAKGFEIGKSRIEKGEDSLARQLLRDFRDQITCGRGCQRFAQRSG